MKYLLTILTSCLIFVSLGSDRPTEFNFWMYKFQFVCSQSGKLHIGEPKIGIITKVIGKQLDESDKVKWEATLKTATQHFPSSLNGNNSNFDFMYVLMDCFKQIKEEDYKILRKNKKVDVFGVLAP